MAGGSTLLDRVYVNTATAGTGTVTLGAAKSNAFCTVADAGGTNGQTYTYCIEDGTDFEIGQGVYTSSGTTLTRATVYLSKIAGVAGTTKLNLSGAATVRLIAAKEDLTDASLFISGLVAQARLGSGSGGAGLKALFDDQSFKTITTNGLVSRVSYTSTQTITIPAGATRASITLWGGTGGGTGQSGLGASSGGGAGALKSYLTGLTAGNTLALTLGAAGTAGNAANAGAGGNSTLASGTQTISTLTANGGAGGVKGTGSAAAAGGAGGTASGGDINITGQKGGSSFEDGTPTFINLAGGMTGLGLSVGAIGTSASNTGNAGTIGGCEIEWYS